MVLDLQRVEDLSVFEGEWGDSADLRSLIVFDANYVPYGRPREGTWYNLDVDALSLRYFHDSGGDNGPALKRGRISTEHDVRFSDFRVSPLFLSPGSSVRAAIRKRRLEDLVAPSRVRVVDCGQGNWNELLGPDWRLIYDCGASWKWTKRAVRKFVQERQLESGLRTILVVSHFDVDHYHALLEASDSEVGQFELVLAPNRIPGTATAKRFLARLASQGVKVRLLPPTTPLPGDGRKIMLRSESRLGSVEVLRATPGASRNQTGIALIAKGTQRTAVLTGDHHHPKVLEAVLRYGHGGSEAVYVVPHHGGAAGKLVASDWGKVFGAFRPVLSYGQSNSYGHPRADVLRELHRLRGLNPLHETAHHGDFEVAL